MYYRLKKNYILRGWEKLPYALADTDTGRILFLDGSGMDALRLCDGTVDLSLPVIPKRIRDLIPLIEEKGIIEPCAPGKAILPEQEYKKYSARYIEEALWSITGRCNYRCRHCYMSAPDARLGELDHETVMDMVSQLADCGVRNVSLTGGEPLVRKDFMEIVDALLERDIHIRAIYSNGGLVTDSLLDALAERGVRPEFNMSYDGEGCHDWLRGIPGAEKAVEEAFLRCRRKGFPTGAEMCIHNANRHTLRKSVRNLAAWGCRSLKVVPVSDVGAWKEGGMGQSIRLEELYRLYLEYIPQYYEDGMPLVLQLGGFFRADPQSPGLFAIPAVKSCGDPDKTCICGHARLVLYISAEGRALPCMALSGMDIQREFPLIPQLGLAKCITDSRYMRLIDTRASEYLEKNPECAACGHARKCLGGCRASALENAPGYIMGPDPYVCELFRGGWDVKIMEAVRKAKPEAKCAGVS